MVYKATPCLVSGPDDFLIGMWGAGIVIICDRICEKGSYTRIRFCNFEEA